MKVLLVKTSALGDLIHIFPVVSYLKRRFPAVEIDWVVETRYAELVHAHPDITKVIEIDTKHLKGSFWTAQKELRSKKYDLLFDLQGNIKSGIITALARAEKKVGFGLKTASEWPNTLFTHLRFNPREGMSIYDDYLSIVRTTFADVQPFDIPYTFLKVTEAEEERVEEIVLEKGELVMVCPGSAWPNKQLDEESLVEVLKGIKNDPFFYFIWGNDSEKEFSDRLQSHFKSHSRVVDRLPIPLLQRVMCAMSLVVSMDSFPLHLAAASGVPTLSFFGPTSSLKYAPKGTQHTSTQGACPYGQTFAKRCPYLRTCKDAPCIKRNS